VDGVLVGVLVHYCLVGRPKLLGFMATLQAFVLLWVGWDSAALTFNNLLSPLGHVT
jgi:hypothetical protein